MRHAESGPEQAVLAAQRKRGRRDSTSRDEDGAAAAVVCLRRRHFVRGGSATAVRGPAAELGLLIRHGEVASESVDSVRGYSVGVSVASAGVCIERTEDSANEKMGKSRKAGAYFMREIWSGNGARCMKCMC